MKLKERYAKFKIVTGYDLWGSVFKCFRKQSFNGDARPLF